MQSFLENWEAHSVGLESSYQLKYNRFIILAVNQEVQAATGCSIDASVQFIQKLEQKYNVDLLDKMNVTFKLGEHVAHKTLIDFKKMAKALKVKKVQMADTTKVERTTGYVLGGVSPLGQKKRLPTVIHQSAATLTDMYFSAGKRGLELQMTPTDLQSLLTASFSDIVND